MANRTPVSNPPPPSVVPTAAPTHASLTTQPVLPLLTPGNTQTQQKVQSLPAAPKFDLFRDHTTIFSVSLLGFFYTTEETKRRGCVRADVFRHRRIALGFRILGVSAEHEYETTFDMIQNTRERHSSIKLNGNLFSDTRTRRDANPAALAEAGFSSSVSKSKDATEQTNDAGRDGGGEEEGQGHEHEHAHRQTDPEHSHGNQTRAGVSSSSRRYSM